MAEEEIRLPLLDQLLDDDPFEFAEDSLSSMRVHDRLVEAIKRDLRDLLNTRERHRSFDEELDALSNTIVDYGMPDVTSANVGSPKERAAFLKSIEKTIRRFDSRFLDVKVTEVEAQATHDRKLHFQIEATFRPGVGLGSRPFRFELDPISRSFQ